MGYPMTWQWVVSRNTLAAPEGKARVYRTDELPFRWQARINLDHPGLVTPERHREIMWPEAVKRIREYEQALAQLLGDVARFEDDTVDERATRQEITRRTGIDADTVAAVLKEFMAW